MSKWIAAALLCACGAYAATGVYTVGHDQRALVRRFGGVIREESPRPGLHWDLPRPFSRVDLIKPKETKTITVGAAGPADRVLGAAPTDTLAQFLTGDQNLANVQATVQYTISDSKLKEYLFGSADPTRAIARAAESAITVSLADQSIDVVLTSGKSALEIRVKDRLQQRLDQYDLGIEVRSVSFKELAPPPQVADAFTKAASARSERERLVLEARTYANEKIAQARGEEKQILDRANADHDRAIDMAKSEADRFHKIFYEYDKSPEIAATRLYLETMAEIIPRFRSKVFIDSGKGVDLLLMRGEPGQ